MAGLFFCLASAEGAGLLFYPATIQLYTIVYSGFYIIHASYTTHTVKQRTGLYMCFSYYLPCFAAAVVWLCIRLCRTTCATLERITAPQHLQSIPDTSAPPGRCATLHSRPIIIRYIRAQHTADRANPAGSASPPVQGQPGGVSMLPMPGISLAPG